MLIAQFVAEEHLSFSAFFGRICRCSATRINGGIFTDPQIP